MRRRLAEQPRVAVAQMLLVAALLAGAVYMGTQIAGGDRAESATQEAELRRTREELRLQRLETGELRQRGDRLEARARAQRRRVGQLERSARSLRRTLDRRRRRGAQGPQR